MKEYKRERIDSLLRTTGEMMIELKERIIKGELSPKQIAYALEKLALLQAEIEVFNSDDFQCTLGEISDFDRRTSNIIIDFGTVVSIYEPKFIR